MPALRKINCKDLDLERVQDNISTAYDSAVSNPLLNGSFLTDIALSVGDNTVSHKLFRIPVGYLIVLKNANSDIYNGEMNDRFLILNASVAVTVSIYIF